MLVWSRHPDAPRPIVNVNARVSKALCRYDFVPDGGGKKPGWRAKIELYIHCHYATILSAYEKVCFDPIKGASHTLYSWLRRHNNQ